MKRVHLLLAIVALVALSMLLLSVIWPGTTADIPGLRLPAMPHWDLQLQQPIVTFLVPTVNRPTLNRTLHSLQAQTSPLWKCIVIFDNVTSFHAPLDIMSDHRFKLMVLESKAGQGNNSAGMVRNAALPHVDTPWLAFVDDDDTLSPHYVAWLLEEAMQNPSTDVLIFRMARLGQRLLPPYDLPVVPPAEDRTFRSGFVGISFSMKTFIAQRDGFEFIPHPGEDFVLLNRLRLAGNYSMVMAEHIGYFVRQEALLDYAHSNLTRQVVEPADCTEPDMNWFGMELIPLDCRPDAEAADLLCPCPKLLMLLRTREGGVWGGPEPAWLQVMMLMVLAMAIITVLLVPIAIIWALCCARPPPAVHPKI
jgi:hypothetical protein